jgi:D-alanyl-D-alanine carboxypeptidase/D-alanyl-D-alanine-endopeptidase (penicillin-binding protein 4)
MGLPRKMRALLLVCGVLCMGVLVCSRDIAAQSRASKVPNSRRPAAQAKPAERADVARFRQRVDIALSAPDPDKGFWGMLVTDSTTGELLYSRNAGNFFSPASDAKLFTTALALATLGPGYRIRTTISSTGILDANGVLSGDLILNGRGDANLSNRKFPYEKKIERDGPSEKALAALADAVVARGVKEIDGGVIADDSLFQQERFPSGWTVDDMLWSYGAAVSAIAVNDNTFTLELRPGGLAGDPATYSVDPASDFYTIENLILTGPHGSEEKLAAVREPGSRLVRVSGTIPAGAQPRRLTIAIEEPAEYAATLLARLLQARGIQIHGLARARHFADPSLSSADRPGESVLAERMGEPLAEEIRHVNKNSLNLHAELLLLLAAHEKSGAISREDAVKFAADFYRTAGIADGDIVLSDGSGLSRRDLVTPRAIVQLLNYAAAQPWGEVYRSSLPVAGVDGTLSERMKNTAAEGHIFAKTGTVEHVVALSGYATTAHGAHLTFSIVGNNNSLHAQSADAVLDSIAVAMVEELGAAPVGKQKKLRK